VEFVLSCLLEKMVNRSVVYAVVLSCLSLAVCAGHKGDCDHGDMDSNCTYTEQPLFDYMLFVKSWDGSFCSDGCCVKPDASGTVNIGFSVHGMWPEYFDDTYPACCTSNLTREMIDETLEKHSDLRAMLDIHWPALKKCRFVRYETEKHGSCAAAVYGANEDGLVNYWTAILKLSQKYDYERALSNAGIVPSDVTKYKISEVRQALHNHVGYKINVVCQDPGIIDEVRVCVKRPTNIREMINPVVFDCPNADNSCDDKVLFLPLPNVPSGGGCKN